jgi:Uma2 family endonuclease
MTEAEFDAWLDEDVKAEWVNGEVIVHMPDAPKHNAIAIWLTKVMGLFIDRLNLGVLFGSTVEIRLPGLRRVPDLCFVVRERQEIVKATRIEGAPDLIVEIVSPDSVERDWRDKYYEYEANGVREYWIIDLNNQRLRAYQRGADGRFAPIDEADGKIASQVLAGFWVRPSDLWQDPLPSTVTVLQELGVLG